MATAAPGLRERKKRATRRALHSAALRLVAAQGYDAVTIEDIAAAADVSTRTFFNYFPTKEDAVVSPDPQRVVALRERLAARPAGEQPLASLHAVLRGYAAVLAAEAEDALLRLRIVRDTPALTPRYLAGYARFESELAHEIATRCGPGYGHELYPALVTACAVAALRAAVTRWRASGGTADLADLVDEAFAALGEGLPEPTVPVDARGGQRT